MAWYILVALLSYLWSMIKILNMRAPYDGNATVVNTCANNLEDWQSDLSPFVLGPCKLYGALESKTFENAWQYAKVYAQYADANGDATLRYWQWAQDGWDNSKAIRYPMGRGAKPLYSLWEGKKLGYVEARKQIYAPLYIKAVIGSKGFDRLVKHAKVANLAFRDFDGYDHEKLGMSLTDVLNDEKRKMGHAFILKMLLTNDPALEQILMVSHG